jgi:hypothetical protein
MLERERMEERMLEERKRMLIEKMEERILEERKRMEDRMLGAERITMDGEAKMLWRILGPKPQPPSEAKTSAKASAPGASHLSHLHPHEPAKIPTMDHKPTDLRF